MNMGEASQDGHVNKGPTNLPNGAIYEGSWLGDQRDGFGIQVWPDGSRYEGLW